MKPVHIALIAIAVSVPFACPAIQAQEIAPPTLPRPEIETRRVYVAGEVLRPGTLAVASGCTLPEAIAFCGGVTGRGDSGHVTVKRENAFFTLNLTNIPQTPTGKAVFTLQEGDMVFVPARAKSEVKPLSALVKPDNSTRVLMMGSVNHPGYYSVAPGKTLSVHEVIALAGGMTPAGDPSAITRILKQVSGESKVASVMRNVKLEQILADGDVIYVPSTSRAVAPPLKKPTDRVPKFRLLGSTPSTLK
jgi:protein involved in polysaccharide export with SLBB domain